MDETTALFAQYLKVVNRALHENRTQFPYEQIIGASEKMLGDKEIGVAVYKDDPSAPHDFFTVTFKGGTFNLLSHGKDEPDLTWKLPDRHLQEVVDNPEPYVQQPARLDLDWLKKRAGLAS